MCSSVVSLLNNVCLIKANYTAYGKKWIAEIWNRARGSRKGQIKAMANYNHIIIFPFKILLLRNTLI